MFFSFQGPPSLVACDHRHVCDSSQPSSSCLLFPDGRSSVGGHGCDDAAVGWSPGLCLSSLRHSPALHREGPAVSGAGAHVRGSLLAAASVVSGSSGASGGCPSVPSTSEGSTQTAPLPSFSPEPPRASSDCVSYIERSARSLRLLFGSGSPTCPLPPLLHPSELSGQVGGSIGLGVLGTVTRCRVLWCLSFFSALFASSSLFVLLLHCSLSVYAQCGLSFHPS